ncbi:MAG: hypothetical protein K2R98_09345 [Gemmataceae bacterium]|nr:hypothetical protein [Gemmataceae bacterium]
MLYRFLIALVAILILGGGLLAAEGVVVSYDKDSMKLIVKVADKEKTYELTAKIHVHDVDGSEIKPKDRSDKLKKDTKIDIEEKNGKLVEINLKK